METNTQEPVPVQSTPTPSLPVRNKGKVIMFAALGLVILAGCAGAAYYFTQSGDPVPVAPTQETPATQPAAVTAPEYLFYMETKMPEYKIGSIDQIGFTLRPLKNTDWPKTETPMEMTLQKPDGSKATVSVKLEPQDPNLKCGPGTMRECNDGKAYFKPLSFTFTSYDMLHMQDQTPNLFTVADAVGTWTLTSSSPLVRPLSFQVKDSRINSIFLPGKFGAYDGPLGKIFVGDVGNHEIYSAVYDRELNKSVNVYLAIENGKPPGSEAKTYDTYNPTGGLYLDKTAATSLNGQKIKVNQCYNCPGGPAGFTIFTFSAGWPTAKGFVVIFGGLGTTYGVDEKEIIKRYQEKYPSILK